MKFNIFNRWTLIFLFNVLFIYLYNFYNAKDSICIRDPNISYTHIIGAGTSGCVLAAHLSENINNSVLLVEAGDHFNIFSKIPLLATFLQKSQHDWSYVTESQKWSSKGFFQHKQSLPRGKGLGGSGQMNFMIHHGVDEESFELWDFIGAHGLKKHIIKFFKRHPINTSNLDHCNYKEYLFYKINGEKMHYESEQHTQYPIHLKRTNSYLNNILQDAILQIKKPKLKYRPCLSTIYQGQRWSTYYSHLLPAIKRHNLHVLCNTEVLQIVFKIKRAVGIDTVNRYHSKYTIYSESEIILCGGTINTPKLLLLSGIGNSSTLQELNIPVITNAPGVGLNLHDHLNIPLYVSLKQPISLTVNKILSLKQIYNYAVYRKGLFAASPIAGIAHLESNSSLILFSMGSTNENILCSIANYIPMTFRSIFPFYDNFRQEGFVFLAGCNQPRSRGFIKLKNSDPFSVPVIDPQYLHDEHDVACMIKAVKLADTIINTSVFKNVGTMIHWPHLDKCKNYKVNPNDREYLECIIRTAAVVAYHQAGTCKMGSYTDKLAVVDHKFRVKGVTGLRIVDASILPTSVVAFPNAVLVAIAEYASEQIQVT